MNWLHLLAPAQAVRALTTLLFREGTLTQWSSVGTVLRKQAKKSSNWSFPGSQQSRCWSKNQRKGQEPNGHSFWCDCSTDVGGNGN